MNDVMITLFTLTGILFLGWIAYGICEEIRDIKRPRFIKTNKFLFMVNDGDLLKITWKKGIKIQQRYTTAKQMFLDISEEDS